MHVTAAGMQAAAVSVAENALVTDQDALARVEAKLEKAPKSRRHGLSRRRQRLASRITRRERQLAANDVRVVFGGRKLARAGNDPAAAGYADQAEWRATWERARSATWFAAGDAEHSAGNFSAQVELDVVDVGTGEIHGDRVTLRVPEFLRELNNGAPTVTVPVRGFDYRREDLAWALEPSVESLAARAAEQQAARLEGRKSKRTIVKRNSPVSVRVSWNEGKQGWYVHATCQPRPAVRTVLTELMLGVDINPDHLAWSLVTKHGNPVKWGRIPLNLDGTVDQNLDRIGVAVRELVAVAVEHGAAIACEKLDFTRARSGLRYLPARTARLLSSFAYGKVLSILASRAQREGVQIVPVNPAYTSVLGQANYAAVHGVSVDQAAACVIARRGLGLRTRLRPQVRSRIPVAEGHNGARRRPRAATSTHPVVSTDQQWLVRAARALPRRSSTWDVAGLCARAVETEPMSGLPLLSVPTRPPRKRRASASAGRSRPQRA